MRPFKLNGHKNHLLAQQQALSVARLSKSNIRYAKPNIPSKNIHTSVKTTVRDKET
jgi:hypothetical protein